MRPRSDLWLSFAAVVVVLACASQGDEAISVPVDDPPAPVVTPSGTPSPPSGGTPAPPEGDVLTPPPTVPGPPGGQGAGQPDATSGEWTTGIVGGEGLAAGVATLEEVRAARHEGFDRVVFAFSPGVPGYHLEYVDRPVRACGSGEPVPLPGDGWLEVRLEPAAAHTETGEPTVGREVEVDLENVQRLVSTCDFEAVVTWVLAVGSPNEYRALVLDEPPRLVIDVSH